MTKCNTEMLKEGRNSLDKVRLEEHLVGVDGDIIS